MKHLSVGFKLVFLALFSLALSGCFFKEEALIAHDFLYAESGDQVEVYAREGGKKYRWKQLSGIRVAIENKRASTLKFTAPTVTEKTDLVFELKAKFDDPVHDQITITVFPILTINGVRLPPEPLPEENNATLLGVDSNNNQVRDDVERWIYTEFKDKHPVHIEVSMQSARTWERIFEGGANKALETVEFVHAALACQSYYKVHAKDEPLLIFESISLFQQVKRKVLSIPERTEAFFAYDKALSGGVYTLPKSGTRKGMCDFDTAKVVGE
ncbi:hypothetical protein MNBD_GAMMA04-157 [hydrothermal vent metagenome]|uniref:Lipoprotein n=1 Tax=hydrothermal vent metagenome TaxID=652676 RepID=A0A3B0VYF2_9ZZZZ